MSFTTNPPTVKGIAKVLVPVYPVVGLVWARCKCYGPSVTSVPVTKAGCRARLATVTLRTSLLRDSDTDSLIESVVDSVNDSIDYPFLTHIFLVYI